MAWLHKLPPMISALAFGYGVGMATPDSTLSTMRSAVDGARIPTPQGRGAVARGGLPPEHAWAGRGPTSMARAGTPGQPTVVYVPYGMPLPDGARGVDAVLGRGSTESQELARLRAAMHQGDGQSCRERPQYSRPPRYVSEAGPGMEGFDDLDAPSKEALSRLQLPDFNTPITRRALKYVRFLTRSDRGRGLFGSWLKRSGRYQDMVLENLRERNLPEDLIWVAMIESGFDPRAKSPAGAMGLWQFMRSTGQVYGLHVDTFVDDRKNPVAATRAAAHHLRDLYQRFGAWELALAAYNMGYEQLLNAIDQTGTTDFNELARQRAIPSETSAYVPKIVAAALVANNLERYGFEEVKLYKPLHTSELSVPGGTRMSIVAKAAGITKGELRKFNPHLLTDHVPPRSDFVLMLPSDTLSRARAALPAMMDRRHSPSDAEVLDPVEWLGGSKTRDRRHQRWNAEESLLTMLPKPKRRVRAVLRDRQRAPQDDALAPLADEFGPRRAGRETVMYRVGPGDTLMGVARHFVVDVEDLARDNGLDVQDKLREGALLKLMVKREVLDRWTRKRAKAASKKSRGAGSQPRKKAAKQSS